MSAIPVPTPEESNASNEEYATPNFSQQSSPTTEELERLPEEGPDNILSTAPFLVSPEQPDWDSLEVQNQGYELDPALQLYDPFAVEERGIWPNLFPLSPGPLYSSPTNKAAVILDMCEFPFQVGLWGLRGH